ncbi:glycosyltransferase [Niabella sp. CC-SYL272]|uniref:glycosyltransferase n=1 Tax=Niabella agricola TaxID=2891571 RepID=UPI001F2F2DEB|nr:glycosyltransferase [Niabella agricola]MCF3109936.1 glycosyltransferase [Niabella agricola]
MKIIRLSTFLDYGGIESKMVKLSSHEDFDNEWVFMALGKGGKAADAIARNGKRVVCLNLDHRIPAFTTIWGLSRSLKNEKPDVLHTSGAEANFFGFIAGKIAGIPKIIVEEIGIATQSRIGRLIFKYIFRNSSIAVGESKIVLNNIKEKYGLTNDRVKVIYNFGTFDYDFRGLTANKKNNFFQIIMVSRLEPVKNITGVLHVMAKLVHVDHIHINLVILGSGSLEVDLRNEVKSLDIEDYVDFKGLVEDPYPYLLQSDLYILNSFSEGFSNALLEAMYCKVPSLSTNVGVAPEIINDGVNGFIVPADDTDALYERLRKVVTLPKEELLEVGLSGYECVVSMFSLDKHIKELMEIYI